MSENLSVTNLQMVGDRLTDILDLNRRRDADNPSAFDTDRAPDSVVKEELKNLSVEYPNETKAAARALRIDYLLPEDDSVAVSCSLSLVLTVIVDAAFTIGLILKILDLKPG